MLGVCSYPLPEPTKALPLEIHKIRRRQIVGRLPSGGDTALQLKSVAVSEPRLVRFDIRRAVPNADVSVN